MTFNQIANSQVVLSNDGRLYEMTEKQFEAYIKKLNSKKEGKKK